MWQILGWAEIWEGGTVGFSDSQKNVFKVIFCLIYADV